MSASFENKLVAILNKDVEPGILMNALAHMSIGLGADVGKTPLRLDTYEDAQGKLYPNISQIPFIILRAKSNEIRKTVLAAREHKIQHGIFVNTMTGGVYAEQLERTRSLEEEALNFYGCVLFGSWEKVSELTKRFSLWK